MYDLIPRESDLVELFVFGQGRIQIPSLACIFDENEDPQNEDTLLKQVQKRLALPLWTKIMFMRHTTKTRILTEILNSEFYTPLIYNGIFQQQRAPWSLQWDYFKAKMRFNRRDMTCIWKMRCVTL